MFFVKDPQRQMKDLLKRTDPSTPVTRVLGIEKLRKRYGTFEARRELLRQYDHFLVDMRVAPMLPRLLGNAFVHAKRVPIAVRLKRDVPNAIRKALHSTSFTPSRGTSVSVKVGRWGFTRDQIVENLYDVVTGVVGKSPGAWGNVQSIQIKADKSPALPVYFSLPSVHTTVDKTDVIVKDAEVAKVAPGEDENVSEKPDERVEHERKDRDAEDEHDGIEVTTAVNEDAGRARKRTKLSHDARAGKVRSSKRKSGKPTDVAKHMSNSDTIIRSALGKGKRTSSKKRLLRGSAEKKDDKKPRLSGVSGASDKEKKGSGKVVDHATSVKSIAPRSTHKRRSVKSGNMII